MTRDDYYQVVYKCSVCGKVAQIDGLSLAKISQAFGRSGWQNIARESANGKVEYAEFCPKHNVHEEAYTEARAALDWEDEEHRANLDQLDDQDAFLQGTGRM